MTWLWIPIGVVSVVAVGGTAWWNWWRLAHRRLTGEKLTRAALSAVEGLPNLVLLPILSLSMSTALHRDGVTLPWMPLALALLATLVSYPSYRAAHRLVMTTYGGPPHAAVVEQVAHHRRFRYFWALLVAWWPLTAGDSWSPAWFGVAVGIAGLMFIVVSWIARSMERTLSGIVERPVPAAPSSSPESTSDGATLRP